MLPLKEAIQKLSFHRAETPGADDTQLDTQTPVKAGHLLSTIVTLPVMVESEKNPLFTGVKSPFVPLKSQWVKSGEMVGATGFEPATSWSQTKCSTRLSYAPQETPPGRPPVFHRIAWACPRVSSVEIIRRDQKAGQELSRGTFARRAPIFQGQ
jgi:hypothetical protein